MLQELGLGDRASRLQLNVGHRQFAGIRVGAPDGRRQRDGRMSPQRVLDDLRVDIVPAANDQLLLAPREPEVALRIPPAEVAGIEPAFAVDLDEDAFVMMRVEVA